MKTKSILKFYFQFEKVEGMLDRLILSRAVGGGIYTAERCFGRVTEIIEKKMVLCNFWLHLDKVMDGFCQSERDVLENYALSRGGVDKRQAHKLVVRFTRAARAGLGNVRAGLEVLKEYLYC